MELIGTGRRRRWIIALLIALVLVGVGLAAFSALRIARRGRPPPPGQTDVTQIAGWMTVPYVSRRFRVPPEEIARAIGLPLEGVERRSFDDLARLVGRSSGEVLADVRAVVLEYQRTHPDAAKPIGRSDRPADRAPPRP